MKQILGFDWVVRKHRLRNEFSNEYGNDTCNCGRCIETLRTMT